MSPVMVTNDGRKVGQGVCVWGGGGGGGWGGGAQSSPLGVEALLNSTILYIAKFRPFVFIGTSIREG